MHHRYRKFERSLFENELEKSVKTLVTEFGMNKEMIATLHGSSNERFHRVQDNYDNVSSQDSESGDDTVDWRRDPAKTPEPFVLRTQLLDNIQFDGEQNWDNPRQGTLPSEPISKNADDGRELHSSFVEGDQECSIKKIKELSKFEQERQIKDHLTYVFPVQDDGGKISSTQDFEIISILEKEEIEDEKLITDIDQRFQAYLNRGIRFKMRPMKSDSNLNKRRFRQWQQRKRQNDDDDDEVVRVQRHKRSEASSSSTLLPESLVLTPSQSLSKSSTRVNEESDTRSDVAIPSMSINGDASALFQDDVNLGQSKISQVQLLSVERQSNEDEQPVDGDHYEWSMTPRQRLIKMDKSLSVISNGDALAQLKVEKAALTKLEFGPVHLEMVKSILDLSQSYITTNSCHIAMYHSEKALKLNHIILTRAQRMEKPEDDRVIKYECEKMTSLILSTMAVICFKMSQYSKCEHILKRNIALSQQLLDQRLEEISNYRSQRLEQEKRNRRQKLGKLKMHHRQRQPYVTVRFGEEDESMRDKVYQLDNLSSGKQTVFDDDDTSENISEMSSISTQRDDDEVKESVEEIEKIQFFHQGNLPSDKLIGDDSDDGDIDDRVLEGIWSKETELVRQRHAQLNFATYILLGKCAMMQFNFADADYYFNMSRKCRHEVHTEDNDDLVLATVYLELGHMYLMIRQDQLGNPRQQKQKSYENSDLAIPLRTMYKPEIGSPNDTKMCRIECMSHEIADSTQLMVDAIAMYEQARKITERQKGEFHLDVAHIAFILVDLYFEREDFRAALSLAQQSFKCISHFQRTNPQYLEEMNSISVRHFVAWKLQVQFALACCYIKCDQYVEAAQVLERSCLIAESGCHLSDRERANFYKMLGNVLMVLKRWQEAFKVYQQSCHLYAKASSGNMHSETIRFLVERMARIGVIIRQQEDEKEDLIEEEIFLAGRDAYAFLVDREGEQSNIDEFDDMMDEEDYGGLYSS